jgi:hypothetical protein
MRDLRARSEALRVRLIAEAQVIAECRAHATTLLDRSARLLTDMERTLAASTDG